MSNPEWMKPHLRARLEQERKEATRTGPVNGEKALTAENGKVKEVITNHKPAPAKADFNVGDTSTYMRNGKPTRGIIKSVGPMQGIKTPIEVEFPDGTTEHYLVNPLPHCENSDYSKAPKNAMDDDAPELTQEFFDKAIVTKPGESIVENMKPHGGLWLDKMFEQLYGPFTSRFRIINGLDGKQEAWEYTYDNKRNIVAKRRAW